MSNLEFEPEWVSSTPRKTSFKQYIVCFETLCILAFILQFKFGIFPCIYIETAIWNMISNIKH
jgi:hypothetical protein